MGVIKSPSHDSAGIDMDPRSVACHISHVVCLAATDTRPSLRRFRHIGFSWSQFSSVSEPRSPIPRQSRISKISCRTLVLPFSSQSNPTRDHRNDPRVAQHRRTSRHNEKTGLLLQAPWKPFLSSPRIEIASRRILWFTLASQHLPRGR